MRLGITGLVLVLATVALVSSGYGSESAAKAPLAAGRGHAEAIANHIALLKSGGPQQRAAAAYWLGQQHSAAAEAVDPLVELLGNSAEIDPSRYRAHRILQKLTLGEEAAAALVNIGHPAIEPLIRVLKSSPAPIARKNAAWALGALHETGATSSEL
jgi:HEAT repeat protein